MFPTSITLRLLPAALNEHTRRLLGTAVVIPMQGIYGRRLLVRGIPGSPNPGIPPVTGPTGPGGNAPPGINLPPPPGPTPEQLAAAAAARARAAQQPRMGPGNPGGGQFVPGPGPENPNLLPGQGPHRHGSTPAPGGPPGAQPGPSLPGQGGAPGPLPSNPIQPAPSVPTTPGVGSSAPISAQPLPPSTMPGPGAPLSIPAAVEKVLKDSLKKGIVPLILTAPQNDKTAGLIQFAGNFGLGQVRTPGPPGVIFGLVANAIFVARQVAHAFDKERELLKFTIPDPEALLLIEKGEARDKLKRDQRLAFSSKPSDGI